MSGTDKMLRDSLLKQHGPDKVADLVAPKVGLAPGQCSTDSVFAHEAILKTIADAKTKGETLSYRDAAREVAADGGGA